MFPNCETEIKDKNGNLIPAIDFELLKQELTDNIVDGSEERYRLDWPGKRQSLIDANTPITKTLRPVRKQSKEFDTTENLFIEGDNLEALKLLQNTYLNQVKMIYIDPPYNTGKDFIYKDNFIQKSAEWKQQSGDYDEEGNRLVQNTESNGRFHSDWLSMMYPRLKLAKNLLRDDGVIFISIDDNEQANLKKLCDEIFGEKNFVSQLIWTNKEGGGGGDSKHFKIKHEYILVYAKQKDNLVIEGVAIEDEDRYSLQDNYFKKRGKYQLVKLDSASIQRSKSLIYPIKSPDNTKIFPSGCWRWSNKKVEWGIKEGFIEIKKNKTNNWSVYSKQYLKVDNEDRPIKRNKRQFGVIDKFSTTQSNRKLIDLFGNVYFKYTKPVELINLLTQISCNNSDIILDFFSGSATTAHAVMQLNAEDDGKRKFIMVQYPEKCDKESEAFKDGYKTIADIGKERIRRAGEKIKQENPKIAKELDIGFRVLKLDSSNMLDIYYTPNKLTKGVLFKTTDNIKPERSNEDLLFHVLLDWGIDLTYPIKKQTIAGIEVFFVAENSLVACFAKAGEIDDDFCKQLATKQPLQVVFCDTGFADDDVKINATQIFKQLELNTEIRTI
jgi:adenine-specific DNA-methyltransferase